MAHAYNSSAEPEVKTSVGKPTHKHEDNIKINET
jgi:hypothetical protein